MSHFNTLGFVIRGKTSIPIKDSDEKRWLKAFSEERVGVSWVFKDGN